MFFIFILTRKEEKSNASLNLMTFASLNLSDNCTSLVVVAEFVVAVTMK